MISRQIHIRIWQCPIHTKFLFICFCFATLGGLATVSYAQDELEKYWCDDFAYEQSNPLAWSSLSEEVGRHLEAHRIADAYRVNINALELEVALAGLSWDSAQLAVLRQAIDKYLVQVELMDGKETPTSWDHIPGPDVGKQIQYDFTAIKGFSSDDIIALNCEDIDSQNNTKEPKIIAYFAYAMRETGAGEDLIKAQAGASAQSRAVYTSYKDWLYNGLTMWPWEMLANQSKVNQNITSLAPTSQYIVMRPNASLALNFDGVESSELDYALTLEPFGWIKYRSNDYKKWVGGSLLLSITDNNGIGYGGLFRWDNFTVGAAYHEKTNGPLLYLSLDLYQLLVGKDMKTNQADKMLKTALDRESGLLKN